MSDSKPETHPNDDAPVTTSKTIKPERALSAEVVTINRPARELYDFWRETGNLVQVMDNILAIDAIDSTRSRWAVKGPGGTRVEWEAVITHDVPGETISWQSAPGADVANSGQIEFHDAGARGTVVRAVISYDPPGGSVGKIIAKLFQREPRIQSRRDLCRFKQLMETGEIATAAWTNKQREEDQQ